MNPQCPNYEECLALKGHPIGMYHCAYCGAMVLAGEDCRPVCEQSPVQQSEGQSKV